MSGKYILTIVMCAGLALQSHAQTTDISEYDDVLYINNIQTASADGQITLSLQLRNKVEARGFQCDIYLPEGFSFALDEGFPVASLSTTRTTAKKTDYFNAVIQQDGCLRILCNSTSGYSFSGNSGEVATIVLDVADDIKPGQYTASVRNAKISDPQAQDHKVAAVIESAITVKDETEPVYDEGFSVQIAPFAFDDDVSDMEFVLGAKTALTNIQFDIVLCPAIGQCIAYGITSAIGGTKATTTIDDDETGNIEVEIARKKTNTFSDGSCVAKLEMEYDGTLITTGIYDITVKNIVLTDAGGNTYHAVPYTANIFVGTPKAEVSDGKIKLSGDYSDSEMAQKLIDAIPTDNATVTEIDLTGVTAFPAGSTIAVANPNALIVTKTDIGLTNTKNVVIGETCVNLELTDGKPFKASTKFTATNASFSRDITNLSTICLPYAPSTDNYEYYELAEEDETYLRFTKVECPKANTPYLYRKTGDGTAITGSGVEITMDGAGESTMSGGTWKMAGTYDTKTFTSSDDIYALSNGVLYHNTGTLTMKSFRAYFSKEGSSVKSVNIIIEDATGIVYIDMPTTNSQQPKFNLSGQIVNDNYRGIIIKNGVKTLKR